MTNRTFDAPWGGRLRFVSACCLILCSAVLAAIVFGGVRSWPHPVSVLLIGMATLPLAVIFIAIRSMVRGYALAEGSVRILRPAGEKAFALQDLQSVEMVPGAMNGSRRMFGNGGFLSITGGFRNERLGYYEAYVTDPDRTVVLTFPHRTIVVSPDDPPGFVGAIRGSG